MICKYIHWLLILDLPNIHPLAPLNGWLSGGNDSLPLTCRQVIKVETISIYAQVPQPEGL